MRLKPSGLRNLDIASNFNAVCGLYTGISVRFSFVILCGVYIPVFLCGFAVFVPSLRPPLFRLSSDLKFYYMHHTDACRGIV